MFKMFRFLDLAIEKGTTYLLVICVLSMLFFSTFSIVLRWFHVNLMWIDPFVRHLVFISTFLGGVIGIGKGTHIGIDILGRIVESKGWHKIRLMFNQFIMVVSIAVLVWLLKAGIDFTKIEMEFSKEEFWGIQSGYLVMIIPIGVALLISRFFTTLILSFDKTTGAQ